MRTAYLPALMRTAFVAGFTQEQQIISMPKSFVIVGNVSLPFLPTNNVIYSDEHVLALASVGMRTGSS